MKNRDILVERGYEEAIVFEGPDYDSAIIGVDACSDRVVYDFDLMVEFLMDTDSMTYEEAVEFIEYNTIRACPYIGESAPVVLRRLD